MINKGENINLDEELSKIECEESMQRCLGNLAKGNFICVMEYPNFGDINVKIVGLKLEYIYHRAVHVRILDKGLTKEETSYRDVPGWGMGDEGDPPKQEAYKVQVPVTTEWVNVEWLKNYRKE